MIEEVPPPPSEPPATPADVQITQIEGETAQAIAETHAAVELAAIEARTNEEIQSCRATIANLEAQLSASMQEASNLRSLNLEQQATIASLTPAVEALAEAVEEMPTPPEPSSIPSSTPESEMLTELGDGGEEPAAVDPVEAAVVVEAVARKRKRIIL